MAKMSKLSSLEMLRAIAALLVVLYHTQSIFLVHAGKTAFWGIFGAGARGVDLFFVLSGFIIAHVHASDFGRPRRLANYVFNRVARIYPAVWIMTGFAIATYSIGFGGHEKAGKLTVWSIVASTLLLPQVGDALVNVTWTLKYEIFFYLVFATLILDLRAGLALLAVWQVAVILVSVFVSPHLSGMSSFYLRSLCLEFSIGMGSAGLVAWPSFVSAVQSAASQWALLAVGLIAFIIGMATEGVLSSSGVFCALGAAAIIIGLVVLEQSDRVTVPRSLVFLGGASYSIYLVHFSAISLFSALLAHFHAIQLNQAVFTAAAAFGVGVGVMFDQVIDRPIQRLIRKRIKAALFSGKTGRLK